MRKLILFLFFMCIHCVVLAQSSNWLNSKWEGFVGFEHDTTQYQISFSLSDSLNNFRLFFDSSLCNEFALEIDSLSQKFVRFKTQKETDKSKPCLPQDFAVELIKSDTPNLLFVQYHWWNDELWLGQVKKR